MNARTRVLAFDLWLAVDTKHALSGLKPLSVMVVFGAAAADADDFDDLSHVGKNSVRQIP